MITVGSNESVALEFEVPSNGSDVNVTVHNENNDLLTTISVSGISIEGGEYRYAVIVPASFNSVGEFNYRLVSLPYVDAESSQTFTATQDYVVSAKRLTEQQNSFQSHAQVRLQQSKMISDLPLLQSATEEQFVQAMSSAYQRMKSLPILFSIIRDDPAAQDEVGMQSYTADEWQRIPFDELEKCTRAQLIEANVILGGDPIGDRRRAGLISDSSGESAQFFRSGKPLQVSVTRQALQELGGLLQWSQRVGRG